MYDYIYGSVYERMEEGGPSGREGDRGRCIYVSVCRDGLRCV